MTKDLTRWSGLTGLLAALSLNAAADDYADARTELITAYQAQDYHKPDDSLNTLERLLAKDIDFGAQDLDEFESVRELADWADYAAGIQQLYEAVGAATVALQMDDGRFVPEGIAIDSDGTFFLGSIHRGQLLRMGNETVLLSERAGHWSVFGMRFDSGGDLWFASAAVPQLADVGNDVGKSGLFRIDTETGEYLYVADYIGGLYRVSVSDGSRERLLVPTAISDHGIDGLYRYGDELVAIQNGIRPHRVVAFQLSGDGLSIEDARPLIANHELFDEPTLGVVQGDAFFFVANSHWNRFDQKNQLPEGLSGPIILKVSLASQN